MRITDYTAGVRLSGERVVVLGLFDGVHRAHRHLLSVAREAAARRGAELCVFTFVSEAKALKPEAERIYATETKLALLASAGVEHTVLARFEDLADMDADRFVREVLCLALGCTHAVCGYNFRFSRGACADAAELTARMAAEGRTVSVCEPVRMRGEVLSATAIRAWLREGELALANEALGAPYRLSCRAEHGLGLGRRLGTPTVNLPLPEGLCHPAHGVYRTVAEVDGRRYHAVTNVGVCPTFGRRPAHAECYLLNFDGDVYGKTVTVYFLAYLRKERTFSSPEELKMQIELDKNTTLAENPPLDAVLF